MNKTCYFCAWEEQCGIDKPFYNTITEEICKTRHTANRFKPTDDWLEYEALKKENEELKKEKK